MFLRIIFLSLILSACLPIPHRRTVIPSQDGTIFAGGSPLIGEKVLQSFSYKDTECKNAESITMTDSEGKFHFDERRETFLFVSIGDQHFYTYLCLEYQDRKIWLTFQDVNHEREKPSIYRCEIKGVNPPALPCKPL